MSAQATTDIDRFQQFVANCARDIPDISVAEVWELWQSAQPGSAEYQETVAAIREALAEREAGIPGTPWEEVNREFRSRFNLPPRQ